MPINPPAPASPFHSLVGQVTFVRCKNGETMKIGKSIVATVAITICNAVIGAVTCGGGYLIGFTNWNPSMSGSQWKRREPHIA